LIQNIQQKYGHDTAQHQDKTQQHHNLK